MGREVQYLDQDGNLIPTSGDSGEQLVDPNQSFIARTESVNVGQVGKVLFKNRCSATNKRELVIEKKIAEGQEEFVGNDTFSFRVKLGGELWNKGYYVRNSAGETIRTGTAENGVISGVPANCQVIITDILSGTPFFVEEIDLGSKYDQSYKKELIKDDPDSADALYDYTTERKPDGADGVFVVGKNVKVEITNSIVSEYSWRLIKHSVSGRDTTLEGAQFKLTPKAAQTESEETGTVEAESAGTVYVGISDENGVVVWHEDGDPSETPCSVAPGTYTFQETAAPAGYRVNPTVWDVVVDEHGMLEVDEVEGVIDVVSTSEYNENSSKIEYDTTIYFADDVVYELPATGGIGIHWYIVSGTLMMMLGLLILYKRKFAGEVLKG